MSDYSARLITSLQNQQVKQVAKLEKRSERERERLLPVEGGREVSRALAAGHIPVAAYVCPELAADAEMAPVLQTLEQLDRAGRTRLYTVTPDVYAKLAMRESSGGVLLVIPYLETSLDALALPSAPLVAVVENAEKPGNLGAILRTADAAGVDGLIACHSPGQAAGTDVHNPNTVRASLGTIFSVPLAEDGSEQVIAWLRAQRHSYRSVHPRRSDTLYGLRLPRSHWRSCWAAKRTGSPSRGWMPPTCACTFPCTARPTASTLPPLPPFCSTRRCANGSHPNHDDDDANNNDGPPCQCSNPLSIHRGCLPCAGSRLPCSFLWPWACFFTRQC